MRLIVALVKIKRRAIASTVVFITTFFVSIWLFGANNGYEMRRLTKKINDEFGSNVEVSSERVERSLNVSISGRTKKRSKRG